MRLLGRKRTSLFLSSSRWETVFSQSTKVLTSINNPYIYRSMITQGETPTHTHKSYTYTVQQQYKPSQVGFTSYMATLDRPSLFSYARTNIIRVGIICTHPQNYMFRLFNLKDLSTLYPVRENCIWFGCVQAQGTGRDISVLALMFSETVTDLPTAWYVTNVLLYTLLLYNLFFS